MRVARLSTEQQLEQIAAPWNALAADVPFRSHDWLASWWRFYGAGHDLYVLAAFDDAGPLAGVAPLYLERTAARGRVLKLLGTGDACSDYLSLLAVPGREEEVASAVAQALLDGNQPKLHQAEAMEQGTIRPDATQPGALPPDVNHPDANRPATNHSVAVRPTANFGDNTPEAHWELLELSGVAADDAQIARLVGHLIEDGAKVHRRPGPNCWRIELPASWDELLESMSKSHRKQIRRVERRLLDTGRAVLRTADESNLEFALDLLVDLHQRRRQYLGQPGCFADPAFAGFVREASRRLLASGRLELHWIELDGRPVAAELHLIGDGGMVYAYQAGVEPDALDEEPGRIINVATLKRAIELGRTGFDFLRGDEPYKAHWRAGPRGLLELRVVPRATSARLRDGVWMAGDTVKQMIKTGLNLTGMR